MTKERGDDKDEARGGDHETRNKTNYCQGRELAKLDRHPPAILRSPPGDRQAIDCLLGM